MLLRVTFQTHRVFTIAQPRGTHGHFDAMDPILYHISIRTPSCKRMFGEQHTAWNTIIYTYARMYMRLAKVWLSTCVGWDHHHRAKLGSTPPTRGSGTTSFITQKKIKEGERPIMFNLAWAYLRVVGMSRKGVGIYFCVFIDWGCAFI